MKTAASRQFAQAIVAGCGLFLATASAQIDVVSEFQRIDPFGVTVREDAQSSHREILSPAVARNAIASFQIIIDVPPGKEYYLDIGLNPEDAVQVKVYKELFIHQADGRYVPDELRLVSNLPYLSKTGKAKPGEQEIPGQKVEVYWLDVYVPKGAPVRRIKIAPQVWLDERWLSYPMEVRVVAAEVNGSLPTPGEPASTNFPVDASAQRVWRRKFCSIREKTSSKNALTIRNLVERNARQDAALRSGWTVEDVTRLLGIQDRAQLCGDPYTPGPRGPESYLRLRDRILREE